MKIIESAMNTEEGQKMFRNMMGAYAKEVSENKEMRDALFSRVRQLDSQNKN